MSILKYFRESLLCERDSDVKFMKWALNTHNSLKDYVKTLDYKNEYPQLGGGVGHFPEDAEDDYKGDENAYIDILFESFLPKDDIIFKIHNASHVDTPLLIRFEPLHPTRSGYYTHNTAKIIINCDYGRFHNLHDIVAADRSTIIHELKHLIQSLSTQGKVDTHYGSEINKGMGDSKNSWMYSHDTHPEIYYNLTDEINARIVEYTVEFFSDKRNKNIDFNSYHKKIMERYGSRITPENKKKITNRVYGLYRQIMSGEVDIQDLKSIEDSYASTDDAINMGRSKGVKGLKGKLSIIYDIDIENIWDVLLTRDHHKRDGEPFELKDVYDIIKLYEESGADIDPKIYDLGLYFSVVTGNEKSFNEFLSKGALVDVTIDYLSDGYNDYDKALYDKLLSLSTPKSKLKYLTINMDYNILDDDGNIDHDKFLKQFGKDGISERVRVNDSHDIIYDYAKKLATNKTFIDPVVLLFPSYKGILYSLMNLDDAEIVLKLLEGIDKDHFEFMDMNNGYVTMIDIIKSLLDYDKSSVIELYNKYNKLLSTLDDDNDWILKSELSDFLEKFKKEIDTYRS